MCFSLLSGWARWVVFIDVIFICVSYALYYMPLDNLGFLMGYGPFDMWRSFITICLRLFSVFFISRFIICFVFFCLSVTRLIKNYCSSIRYLNIYIWQWKSISWSTCVEPRQLRCVHFIFLIEWVYFIFKKPLPEIHMSHQDLKTQAIDIPHQ